MADKHDVVLDCDLCRRPYALITETEDLTKYDSPRYYLKSGKPRWDQRVYKSMCSCRGAQTLTVKPDTAYKRDEVTGLWREVSAEEWKQLHG